jgi:hypothetical protein
MVSFDDNNQLLGQTLGRTLFCQPCRVCTLTAHQSKFKNCIVPILSTAGERLGNPPVISKIQGDG